MKSIKFTLFVISISVFSTLFFSCSDDNNDESNEKFETVGFIQEINIKDIQGIHLPIDEEVVFVARVLVPVGISSSGTVTNPDSRYMLRFPFNKDRMSFTLPQNPDQSLLRKIENDMPDGLTISNHEAKTISFVDIACCTSGSNNILGCLKYSKQIDGETLIRYELRYIYCDSSVKITGGSNDWWGHSATYDLKLEKGWNMVVEKREYKGTEQPLTVTNWLPNGMQWNYDMLIGGK
ncbi:hypothetical protein [Dysgonomonas sp. BGC7]|uniref:hypothetical protein n=1 Tax=Dysgonomonas sp. BGC7 TaxID=1658008 RepID=UPI0006808866|nr:hypothetical protein [Dysgonomonas sp. BGC7]MBD8387108.1 hypothetical protein [Dysgonomonas sp. BGC7]